MFPPTSTRRAFLRRAGSTVLAVAGVSVLTSACDADGDERATTADPSTDAAASADDELVAAALDEATALAALYASTLRRHPELRSQLAGARSDVDEHVEALSGATGGTDDDTATDRPVPQTPNAARRLLAAQEERATRHLRRDANRAASGDLARLLASMAASHAQHVRLLAPHADAPKASAAPDPDTITVEVGPVIDAMNYTLAGEHAAIYAYGVIGGRLDYGSRPVREATAAWEIHRGRRIGLTALVEAGGETPVAAETGYRLPNDVGDVAAARTIAQSVEGRCTVLYATLAAIAAGEVRAYAVDALIDAAVRGYDWGAPTSALPGVADA
ncbi:MAG TPA: ferritin-like domain-containing protein [Nocardioidaceae bacterium]|nr:ferritin-like domain-containing protein [Nocardioidaceae bacterium]